MRRFTKQGRSYTKAGLSGLSAKLNGADAEDAVNMIANLYLQEGSAEICKRYEPYRRVGSGGKVFKATYTERAGCDFELWLADGRAGHIELKSREADRIPKSAIDDMQSAQLSRRLAYGHLALVLVRLRGVWYLVPWERWQEGERKSHNAKQLEEIGVKLPLRSGLPDLLSAL